MSINSELSDNLGLQFTEYPHFFTGNLDILTSPSDIVSINERIMILTIIGQCDIRHIITLTLPIKDITSVLKVSTYIITSISNCPISLDAILVIMSLLTLKTAFILYVFPIPKEKAMYRCMHIFYPEVKFLFFWIFLYLVRKKPGVLYLPRVKSLE
jgi:hypothetical protein